MFEIPHMLTGAAIGKVWPKARYALPAAFLSHFVLDAVPHREVTEIPGIGSEAKAVLGGLAIVGAVALVVGLSWKRPQRWVMIGAAACAIVIDLVNFVGPWGVWFKHSPATAWLSNFHIAIQIGERYCPLWAGIGGQVVVIALALWVILRRKDARRETRDASRE